MIGRIVQFSTFAQRPPAQVGAIFEPQGRLLLHAPQTQGQIIRSRFVVVAVFGIAVIQVVMTQRHRLHVPSGVMAVHGTHSKGFLLDTRQVTEQIFVLLALLVEIELHVVDAHQSEESQLVPLRETGLDLQLPVDVIGQERKPQQFEEELEIGLPHGKEVSRLFAHVSAAAERHFGGTERRLEGLPFEIAVPQPEIQHRTERPGTVGGKRTRIEIDLAHQIGIHDAYGTARGTLRGEMVDIGNFDPVHEEAVFGRSAAPHDQVVAITDGRKRHARIGTYDTRHVAIGAGTLLDLPHPDHLHTDRALDRTAERRGTNDDFIQMLRLLLHLDFDERRPGRHLVFGGHDRSVTDERRRQAVNAGLHLQDLESPERIGHGALTGLAGDRNGCIGDRFPGKTVDNPAPHRIPRCGPNRRNVQYQQNDCCQ